MAKTKTYAGQLYGTLTPAYGRDYKTGEDALADWLKGKDFVINNPGGQTYCSIRDSEDCPVGYPCPNFYKPCFFSLNSNNVAKATR